MEQNQNNNNEIEIDLGELIRELWSKKLIIIMAGIVLMLAAVLLSKFVLPKNYESQTSVLIMNQSNITDTLTSSDLTSGSLLTKDYEQIVKSETVMKTVAAELGLDMEASALSKMISVSISSDSRILTIKVTNTEPFLARDIADSVREASSARITEMMKVVSVSTVDVAKMPESPSSPNTKKNALLGAVAGIALAIFGVLLIYLLDDTIKTPEDVERYLGVGVLGSIPISDGTQKSKKKTSRSGIKKGGK